MLSQMLHHRRRYWSFHARCSTTSSLTFRMLLHPQHSKPFVIPRPAAWYLCAAHRCTQALRRTSGVCFTFKQLLDAGTEESLSIWQHSHLVVPIYGTVMDEDGQAVERQLISAMDVLARAPRGVHIVLRAGLTFHPDIELFLGAAVHISTTGSVDVYARWSLHGETSAIQGTIRGVTFHNWDAEAVRVLHGRWRIVDCAFRSKHSRKPALAANAIILMERTELVLSGSSVCKCKHAVNFLEPASLHIDTCSFEHLNASVRNVAGGGCVTVDRCSFANVKRAFHFDPFVKGYAHNNVIQCEPFGDTVPPDQFDFATQGNGGT